MLKHRREYTTGIIERGCGREADKARGVAECLIRLRDHIPSSIISVVYERERCFNWFVALTNWFVAGFCRLI